MASNAEALRRTVTEQDGRLKEYSNQLEKYLEMLNKERGRKQELEDIVLKQVEETKAMMKFAAVHNNNLHESMKGGRGDVHANNGTNEVMKSSENTRKLSTAGVVVSERLQIAQSLEQCQVSTMFLNYLLYVLR